MAKVVSYRLDDETARRIDALAAALPATKTDVLRNAIDALWNEVGLAQREFRETLDTIHAHHPDAAKLTIDLDRGPDGNPEALVRLDGAEHPDVGARVVVAGDTALVYLLIPDDGTRLNHLLVSVGQDVMLVRPQFPAAWHDWPLPPRQKIRTEYDLTAPPELPVSEAMLALANA